MIETPRTDKLLRDYAAGQYSVSLQELLEDHARDMEGYSEVWRVQRDRALAQKERVIEILKAIHALIAFPPDIEVNGKRYVFDPPESPMYRDSYRQLCKLIREVPERLSETAS